MTCDGQPNGKKLVRLGDLTAGDRYIAINALWTCLYHDGDSAEWVVSRKHSPASISLEENGFGYIGDSVCSNESDMLVQFVPPSMVQT